MTPDEIKIKDWINWRVLLAARYGDEPFDERVGKAIKLLSPHVHKRIAVAYDYKGDLEIIWKVPPTEEEKKEVWVAWRDIGEQTVRHYLLVPLTEGNSWP
jgi:hypothetical protein